MCVCVCVCVCVRGLCVCVCVNRIEHFYVAPHYTGSRPSGSIDARQSVWDSIISGRRLSYKQRRAYGYMKRIWLQVQDVTAVAWPHPQSYSVTAPLRLIHFLVLIGKVSSRNVQEQ